MRITGEMHFAKALDSLKAAGVEITALEPGELYALAEASRRCANPFSEVNAELADRPVRVCDGVWLWPPTAGAIVWLEEFAAKWWPRDSLRFHWAHVYSLVHAREPEAFAALTEKWAAWRAVAGCALRLAVHGPELAAAMRKAYGEDVEGGGLRVEGKAQPSTRDPQHSTSDSQCATDFASLVARLEVGSGIPRNAWLWGRSLTYLYTAYFELRSFAAAFSGESREQMDDELDEAMNRLARAKAAIFRRAMRADANAKGAPR